EHGSVVGVQSDAITFADQSGNRIVATGNFVINNGTLVGGTLTGFDLFAGATRIAIGGGYAITSDQLLTAILAASAGNPPPLQKLFFGGVTQIGSPDPDVIHGSVAAGTILGGKGNDHLIGGEGSEVIRGGAGNDVIIGGGGNNTLFGGSGHDRFEFA